jgi:hypothetical protein
MLAMYIQFLFIGLLIYILLFNICTEHLQGIWSKATKNKVKKIYYSCWILPLLIYLGCIYYTPETRPFFIQHIFLGILIHLVFAVFGCKARDYRTITYLFNHLYTNHI